MTDADKNLVMGTMLFLGEIFLYKIHPVPFSWVRLPHVHCEIIQATRMGGLYYLEQDTGVEPAFTAWEAVVLPIYESCVSGIIANRIGKFNLFLSDSLDKGCFCSPSPGLWVQKEAPQPVWLRC